VAVLRLIELLWHLVPVRKGGAPGQSVDDLLQMLGPQV
jgi:hypothetical protein